MVALVGSRDFADRTYQKAGFRRASIRASSCANTDEGIPNKSTSCTEVVTAKAGLPHQTCSIRRVKDTNHDTLVDARAVVCRLTGKTRLSYGPCRDSFP